MSTHRKLDSVWEFRGCGVWIAGITLTACLAIASGDGSPGSDSKTPPLLQSKPTASAPADPAHPPVVAQPGASSKTNGIAKQEKLLLLDDGPAEDATPGGADNSRCQVCHINFMQEDLAKVHAKANIGCAKCHGECDAHIADESWASGGNGTAPDRMFPKNKINPFCLECHPKGKIDAESHKDFFADTSGKPVCVDCHGKHRMAARKCKWK